MPHISEITLQSTMAEQLAKVCRLRALTFFKTVTLPFVSRMNQLKDQIYIITTSFITAVKDICAISTFEKLLNILFSEVYY